jgi:hypothetical protein
MKHPKAAVVTDDNIVPPLTSKQIEQLSNATEILAGEPTSEYAGAWIDDTTGTLTIGVKHGTDTSDVEAQLAERGLKGETFEAVGHDQSQLDQIVENVYKMPGMEDISSAIHDYSANRIILTSHNPVTDELRTAIYDNFGDAAVIASDPITLAPASRDADTSPFYAGGWLGHLNVSTPICTVGWSWVMADGSPRMLTAGHCYPTSGVGSADKSAATDYGSGSYTYQMGTAFSSTVNSGGTFGDDGDLAMIDTNRKANGDNLFREGDPQMFTGGTTSTTTTTVNSVDKWTSNGTAVCYSGMQRGVQCGNCCDSDGNGGYNVEDNNYSYESGDGRVWTHLAYTTKGWGKCVIPGDSGSPVYINTDGIGVAAHGILQGAAGGGPDFYVGHFSTGHCVMIFTEIGQAYDGWLGHVETIYNQN